MGFNNDGIDAYCQRLEAFRDRRITLGANIGINKQTDTPFDDFAHCLERVQPLADYVTINVSSPNTPGLRDLQEPKALAALLDHLAPKRTSKVPLFLKLAPDLNAEQIKAITSVCLDAQIDGLIVSNTTIARPPTLKSPKARETGGLSGRPLFASANKTLRQAAEHTNGQLPIIAAGGVFSGADAKTKLEAGAKAVQIYSSFVLKGPQVIEQILEELANKPRIAGD